jgi:hypothetical protein
MGIINSKHKQYNINNDTKPQQPPDYNSLNNTKTIEKYYYLYDIKLKKK